MSTTTFTLDLHFQPLYTAEAILGELYTQTSQALDTHHLVNGFCNMYIPLGKKVIFAEVQINALTSDVVYYVTSNQNTSKRIPALTYNQALTTLRSLLA